jgi:hypothetical protein
MQQHDFDVLIHVQEQIFNMSEREEVVPRYRSISPTYYWKDHENAKFEQKIQNFEPLIVIWLNKKPQLRASECPKELSQHL